MAEAPVLCTRHARREFLINISNVTLHVKRPSVSLHAGARRSPPVAGRFSHPFVIALAKLDALTSVVID